MKDFSYSINKHIFFVLSFEQMRLFQVILKQPNSCGIISKSKHYNTSCHLLTQWRSSSTIGDLTKWNSTQSSRIDTGNMARMALEATMASTSAQSGTTAADSSVSNWNSAWSGQYKCSCCLSAADPDSSDCDRNWYWGTYSRGILHTATSTTHCWHATSRSSREMWP